MPFHELDSLRYFTFDSLTEAGVRHAIFTRRGGCSPAPWASLNMGALVGDEPERVAENRRRAFAALEREPATSFDVWQVHSADVVRADAPRPGNAPHNKADAIITDRSHVTMQMRFADCTPVLLYDPVRRVCGMAHAGWMGTVRRTAAAAVQAMQAAYSVQPQNILAAIGPSIGAHHYPVGEEVVGQVLAAFGADASSLLPSSHGAVQFDLWAANRLVLLQAGVRQIETCEICTACHLADWFSHRGERGKTGRFGALMALGDST